MSKRLDDFIHNHRDEFDSDLPSPQVWNKIDERLSGGPKKTKVVQISWMRWSAAAAVVLLIGAAALYWFNQDPSIEQPVAEVKDDSPMVVDSNMLNDINPAYAKELYHFTQLIELRQGELKQMEKENPELYQQFVTDINKLDSSYNVLKQELPANPNREQLLEAMIRNLQVQMDMLNQQLQIIQQIKQSKNKNNDPNSKSI
jgi:hypothetical protein